jgi:hypothetical protein
MNSTLPQNYTSWEQLDTSCREAGLVDDQVHFTRIEGTTAHYRHGVFYIYKDGELHKPFDSEIR